MRFVEPGASTGGPKKDERVFINPETARLEDICDRRKARIIHIPRRRDIQRLCGIAELGREVLGAERGEVRVLDIGGGHGFYDKLLADQFVEAGTAARVVNVDIDEELLGQAERAYGQTAGLEFVCVNVEGEDVDAFPESFDLVIVSWPDIRTRTTVGYRYTEFIHKNRPPFVVWTGDGCVGDLTGEFDMRDEYRPIAEFMSRLTREVVDDTTNHGLDPAPDQGDNLFTVYVRADLSPKIIDQLKQVLLRELEGDRYRWEEELSQQYPDESDGLTFDVEPRELFN